MPEEQEILTAQAVLKTDNGRSIMDERAITTANLNSVVPSEKSLQYAMSKLQELGFSCTASYPTITLTGPVSLFEEMFHLQFETKTQGNTKYLAPIRKPHIPDTLKQQIAEIVFGEPMETFW